MGFVLFANVKCPICCYRCGGGNRPLQGTKLLVIVAMSLSRGESIMRQPTTPAALQPNPMQMEYTILQNLNPPLYDNGRAIDDDAFDETAD